jgi:transcriptional regulator with XRE-family HTH domain
MPNMNEHIRKEVRIAMIRKGVNQTDLANTVGLSRQHLNHLLTGHRGKLPDAWGKLFDALDLELTVKPKHEEKDT